MTPKKWTPKVGERVVLLTGVSQAYANWLKGARLRRLRPDPVPWMKRLVGCIWFTHNIGTDYLQESSPPPCCGEHRLFYELNKVWPEVFKEQNL